MKEETVKIRNSHINENFLLSTEMAKRLYYECAKDLPIIDYHNHLSIGDLESNRRYSDIFELWIAPDPYKHRAMRICGVEEEYITGKAPNFEKFSRWCEIFPSLIGNPLFDWSLMELEKFFSITDIPNAKNCKKIWDTANEMLRGEGFSSRELLAKFNIEYNAPCVSLTDDVSGIREIENCSFSVRCDDIINVQRSFIDKLANITSREINSIEDFAAALDARFSELCEYGFVFTDHALDNGFVYVKDTGRCGEIFDKLLRGEKLSDEERGELVGEILRILGAIYAKRGIVMQLHMGAQRKTSSRLRALAGAAGGYAGIGNSVCVKSLTELLDDMEMGAGLPKTLIFTLNPADHAMISILSGSYSKDGECAIVSEGPAWWWCDHMQGMKDMLEHLSTFGLLSSFFGMTTDSRTIFSFVRHDYFRRVLCMWIGEKVERGEFPDNFELWREVVEKACYSNAKKYIK